MPQLMTMIATSLLWLAAYLTAHGCIAAGLIFAAISFLIVWAWVTR